MNAFFDSARKIQSEFSSSKQYEYISLSQIKKALLISQKTELFQTLLIFENYPKHEEMQLKSEKNNIMNEAGNWRREASATDMSIYIEFNDSSIEIKYIKHLFAPSLIKRILKTYLDTLNNLE